MNQHKTQIDLTARIREILRNYPEGTSIFKELIQNADDAGAREVGGWVGAWERRWVACVDCVLRPRHLCPGGPD